MMTPGLRDLIHTIYAQNMNGHEKPNSIHTLISFDCNVVCVVPKWKIMKLKAKFIKLLDPSLACLLLSFSHL